MLIGLLRYAHVIEKHRNCVLNTAGLSTAWICAAGLIMLGNFQVTLTFVCRTPAPNESDAPPRKLKHVSNNVS